MATFNYGRLAQTAQRLIAKFGALRKIEGFVDSAPNPDQPNRPGERVHTIQDVRAVFLDYKIEDIDGTQIRKGDLYALVSPLEATLPLKLTGTITAASGKYSIVKITELNPGDVSLLYKIQVRK